MLIEQKLEEIKLSPSQESVARYLIVNKEKIKDMTITKLAKATYTSTATIIRLAKKLGYKGFEELKKDYQKEIDYLSSHFQDIDPNYPFCSTDTFSQIAGRIIALSIETLDDTRTLIDPKTLQEAVRLLNAADTIHLCAISYCLMLGQIFRMDMLRIGKRVNSYDISGDELFLPAMVRKGDCALFISYSGQIEKLCRLAARLKEKNIKIIVISSLGQNELKQYADVLLSVSTREKLYSKIKGYANEISVLAILNILYSCCYAQDYYNNDRKRKSISKEAEIDRYATLDIMKEKER